MEPFEVPQSRRARWPWVVAAAVVVALVVCGGAVALIARQLGLIGCVETDLAIPRPDQVKMRVVNSSGVRDDRELDVFVELGQRGFQMLASGSGGQTYPGSAMVQYGPATVGAAQLVRAQLIGEPQMRYSRFWRGDLVELVVGRDFAGVASPVAAGRRLTELGSPAIPADSC